MPDENGLEVSKKLSELIDSMREQGLMDLDKDDRAFVLKVVKVALKKMKLEAGDERDFDPETSSLESVELGDIRSDYGIEEIEEGAGEYSYTLEYNGEENGYAKHKLTITSPEGETKEVADDFTYFDVEGDELQAELESWFHKGMGVADASVDEAVEGKNCGCGKDPCETYGKVEETADKAIQAAIQELRSLAGI